MDYRIERIQGISRVAYIVYSEQMSYLATLSWLNGRLVYDTVLPELVNVSARHFEEGVKKLDKGTLPLEDES